MTTREIPPILRVVGPEDWPPSPTKMSFSSLRDIEACPRRWALGAAHYPEIWENPRYPKKFHPASTIGSIVHLVLEKITKALSRSGCSSVNDPNTVNVLKELGGFTQIIEECKRSVLSEQDDNPRFQRVMGHIVRTLDSKMAEIRETVQILLTRIRLLPSNPSKKHEGGNRHQRSALNAGSHSEIQLKANGIGWVGVADLINMSEAECEIVDYKTSAPNEEHQFQLRVYSLLWMLDTELNPKSRNVSKLTLSYRSGDVDLEPPSSEELNEIERDLRERTQHAFEALSSHPPEARPSLENCKFCDVRHLCHDYWLPLTQQDMGKELQEEVSFVDLQATIIERHGPLSWDAIVESSGKFEVGKQIVFRRASDDMVLQVGDRIRVLDAYLTSTGDDETNRAIVTMNNRSEMFTFSK